MSRSGYVDDLESQWAHIRWRGAVASAIRGTRGQAFLRELRDALDAMPDKRLGAGKLEADGLCCALGVGCKVRGVDTAPIEFPDWDEEGETTPRVADALDIADALAREVMFINDECLYQGGRNLDELARTRWMTVRDWVEYHIIEEKEPQS